MISERYKFIYLHVPKTGGNTTQTALLPLSDDRKVVKPSQDGIERFAVAGEVTPHKHAILADYAARLGHRLEEFHVALTLRDPFQRAVSLYFTPQHWQGKELVFDETDFIDTMRKMVPLVGFLQLDSGLRMPDTVLRFSHLQEDLARFFGRLNLPGLPPRLSQLNRSAASTEMRRQVLNSAELRQIAEDIFAEDMVFLKTLPEGREILNGSARQALL